ncbi:sulfate ABC transporter permease subunit CysT [Neisseria meningitidis]|uniref:sulfate ABC transporter permease subunit CysT n=1 Tax=Neisseria meningitidis TaxID=487 RepID=UPI000C3407DC|nr:sulfate ABC transporter permease subunit CysT [Neisseria meningitidis]MBG8615840.1 sulfate ABC transporter permease subunit CysT [Neisseria meningitidis]MBG8686472.1 sulfate ABC transporter permease subunit CysT [Neisseria meningitidis]MBG8811297.1 sulfate ABC transporter permease subunit CysT [Neisseria meningitidis]MBG8846286.1 sulfate ABC transporter permease subunit CysT [Neisseria meningitidis]MBJ7778854.1 sulfate ABC transporter permease subunit CysT [Neisseria meningitidis]
MLALKTPDVLPGFKLSLGLTVLCLSLLVVLPFAMMAAKAAEIGWSGFWNTITEPNVLAAVWLSLRMSFYAMLTNVVFGTLVAWVLVRYEFPGKGLANALVDLPFALPTAVTGIALATLYAPNGWIGRFFEPLGIKIAFTPAGIWIALVVVSLPFIVRAVQPVLEELSGEYEEAAATLGANRFTTFRRVLLPEITPALLTGSGMMFARATGEYGSVIFIAGNIPMVSEILPLIITGKLEQFDVQGASAVALFMLLVSFVILFALNVMQWALGRRSGAKG